MEVMMEFETEEVRETENVDEVCEDDAQAVSNLMQEPDQIQENADVEKEERVEKLNMKQQIDIKSLITEETKQYIFIEEMRKITKSSLDKQIAKVKQNIKELRFKIRNQKYNQQREEVEKNNENSKLVEIKIFTQSTREIVDILKNYVESLEQHITKLKFFDLEKNVLKKIDESFQMINEKMSKIKQIKTEIVNIESSASGSNDDFENEMKAKISAMKTEIDQLKSNLSFLKQENDKAKEEIMEIDKELEKNSEDAKESVELGTILDLQMKNIENFNLMSTKLQELESERIGLLSNIEFTSALLDNLMEYKEELVKENFDLGLELTKLQEENDDNSEKYKHLEELVLADIELEEQKLRNMQEESEQLITSITKEELDLIQQIHEKEKLLLNEKNESKIHSQELSMFLSLNEEEELEIADCKKKNENLEKDIQEKLKQLEEAEKEQISLENTVQQLEISLENHQKELSLKKERLDYEKNTLQVHLESKLESLKKKLVIIEEKKEEEKRKFECIDAANKKKSSQHQRLRSLYLKLMPQRKVEENNETIEGERTPERTSPKGILKSPNAKKSDPITPTKNVKFVGLSSIPSSNESDIVNAENKEINDAFDKMKNNIVQRKSLLD